MTASKHVDVLVIGAGPTGLTAAGDLARCGRSVVVLERWPDVNPSSRAFATMARTLEVLDARDLADDVIAKSHLAPGVSIFAGARIDLTHLQSEYQFVAVTPQINIDEALAAYATSHGADVLRGLEIVSLEQDSDGVTVTAQPKDDEDPTHRTMWRAARNSSLQTMMIGLEKELAPIHDMMLRTPEDYSAGIELHIATLAALKRGDPAEIEEEMYRHLGHFESIVADVLERTPHRKIPAFLLAGAR